MRFRGKSNHNRRPNKTSRVEAIFVVVVEYYYLLALIINVAVNANIHVLFPK